MAGREWIGVEPAGEWGAPTQGDRGSRVLPLPVHHRRDGAGAHRVCQEHPGLRGPLPQRSGSYSILFNLQQCYGQRLKMISPHCC